MKKPSATNIKRTNGQSAKKVEHKPETNSNQKRFNSFAGLYVLLAAVILSIYSNTISHDFALDDKVIIVQNEYVNTGLSGFFSLMTSSQSLSSASSEVSKVMPKQRPVAMLSHALDVSLFGMNPKAHHATNIFLYLLLALLLFRLLRKHLIPDFPLLVSFFIVLIFIVHPVHVESVANVKGRDDILCFIFGSLSMIYFFRYFESKSNASRILSLLFLILSFLSKESGVVFILIIPLTLYYFTKSEIKKVAVASWPFIAVGGIFVLLRLTVLKDPQNFITLYNNSILSITEPSERFAMTLRILLQYVKIMFWPNPLSWDYSYGHFEFDDRTYILAAVSAFTFAVLSAWIILKIKTKDFVSFGIAFFMISLFPVSNLAVNIATNFGERLLFIPAFGFAVAAIFGVVYVCKKYFPKIKFEQFHPAYIVIAVIALALSVLSFKRAKVWKNDDMLVTNDFNYSKSLRNTRAYIQILTALPDDKISNHQKALDICNNAINRFPKDELLWYYKGVIQSTLNNTEDAKIAYQKALQFDPNNFYTLVNYASLILSKEPEKAIELYKKAVLLRPNDAAITGNLAILLHKSGKLDEAKTMYEKSLALNPSNQNVSGAFEILKKDIERRK